MGSIKQVIVVRKDLEMGTGKIAAQVGHACVLGAEHVRKSYPEWYKEWVMSGQEKVVVKAARSMGLAICGVDFMRSRRGPLVLEVNSSPGFAIEQVTGRNVAEKIIEYVELNAKARRRKDRVGA